MRKIASNIFVVLLILCFTSTNSFSFSNPWKNYNPKCKKYDFRCKRISEKMTVEDVKEVYGAESEEYKRVLEVAKKNEVKNDTELNAFTGMFDFSDDKQKAGVIGLQHQNEDLYRKSFLGKLSPITGAFLTENNAFYLYTGIQAEYDFGSFTVVPSFAPGLYSYGNGKDLGFPLEFKSEVQMNFSLSEDTHLGMSYNHISNASLGTKNPGANSYMFNFLKKF